jgi:Ca2+-binding EF-hand superfamily protein
VDAGTYLYLKAGWNLLINALRSIRMNRFTKTTVLAAVTLGILGTAFAGGVYAKSKHHGFGHHMNFEKVDTNSDGFVTKEEITALHNARFNETDTNKDGGLSKDEMKAAMEKRFAKHKANGKHKHDPAKMEKRFGHMFGKLDKNNDGLISKSEMSARHDHMVAKVDTDKDGKISKAEADAARAKHKKHKKNDD